MRLGKGAESSVCKDQNYPGTTLSPELPPFARFRARKIHCSTQFCNWLYWQ